ncbi:MAG: two component transcriptional regulator, LuxR family [Verrucomicrobiales bacterium]|nr:two component transcriptional regulator, LuxR family [Verrucomicrobiales bacterium]
MRMSATLEGQYVKQWNDLMTRIIIADDHHLVRKGIKSLLKNQSGLEIVAEASDGLEAAEITEKLKPDVLLLDLSLPRLTGIQVMRRLTSSCKTRILVLTMHSDSLNMREALAAGATGYVLKDCKMEELMNAIQTVTKGMPYIMNRLSHAATDTPLGTRPAIPNRCEALTSRERLVLEHAAVGLSNREIAEKLFISPRTAESHRSNIMKKLKLSNQTELVRFAIRERVITP